MTAPDLRRRRQAFAREIDDYRTRITRIAEATAASLAPTTAVEETTAGLVNDRLHD